MSQPTHSTVQHKPMPPLIPDQEAALQHLEAFGHSPARALPLPDEVTLKILGYLKGEELASCELVCKDFQRLSSDSSFWKALFQSHFSGCAIPENVSFKQAYRNLCSVHQNLRRGTFVSTPLPLPEKQIDATCPVIFADGKVVFSAKRKNNVEIWDLDSKKVVNALEENDEDKILSIALWKERIIFSSRNWTVAIMIWNPATGQIENQLSGHNQWVESLACDGGTLLASADNSTIKIWDLEKNECLHTLPINRCIYDVKLVFAGGFLFSGHNDGTIKIWNVHTGECLKDLKEHSDRITSLISVNGKVISGSKDHMIKIWNPKTMACEDTLTGHKGLVTSLFFDNGMLVSYAEQEGCLVKIWDLNKKQCVHSLNAFMQKPIEFKDGKLFSIEMNKYDLVAWDFKKSHPLLSQYAKWEKIADLFQKGDPAAMQQLNEMPQEMRGVVDEELDHLYQSNLKNREFDKEVPQQADLSFNSELYARAVQGYLIRQIAELFEPENEVLHGFATDRYLQLPEEIRSQIFRELKKILPFSRNNTSNEENTFRNDSMFIASSSEQKMQAMINYLSQRFQ